jgi:ribose transport system substrate-binding protein
MEEVAAKENVTITEFDGQFKPEEQTKQLQDAIASQKYDGIVIAAISGEGIIPDLQDAIDQGIKVAVLNQVVGPKLDTPDPQVEGISVSVLAPPLRSGERLGKLTLQACEGMDPCRVAYLYGIKGIPLDTALREGFDSVIAENPAIEVVAEGEGKYLGPDEGAKATQTILAATPDFDVLIGSDQSVQGAQQALEDAGKLDKVKLIGLGGSEAAITAIRDGKWYGGVFGAPYDEGKIAIEALIEAIRENKDTGGVDPLTRLPDEGLVTTDNVDKFESQWAG